MSDWQYETRAAAMELLALLRETYGVELPEVAAGDLDHALCLAWFWGARHGRKLAAMEAERQAKREKEARLPATSG